MFNNYELLRLIRSHKKDLNLDYGKVSEKESNH